MMTDYRIRGVRTQAEVARELGLSLRQVQRIEDEALGLLLWMIARAMREAIGDFSSVPRVPRRFACRIGENQADAQARSQRDDAEGPPTPLVARRRVGRTSIPRRFPRKNP